MAVKKITLTEDHIKLISALHFEALDFSQMYNTNEINDAIIDIQKYLAAYPDKSDRFAYLANVVASLDRAKYFLNLANDKNGQYSYGLNQWNLFGGTYVLEDVSRIIGRYDAHIVGTEEDPMGVDFNDEDKAYMWGLYEDIYENLKYIISLVVYYSTRGGLTPGTYKCIDYIMEWEKIA